jgi:regulator of PEP synthase PpsR (kinase-PPPase family)
MTRSVFYVSDSTAMTAKVLGKSLLSQFEGLIFVEHLRPYTDNEAKVLQLIHELESWQSQDGHAPLVFASMMDEALMLQLKTAIPGLIDIFGPFLERLENLIESKSSKQVGQAHKAGTLQNYKQRIDAVEYCLSTDDGLKTNAYNDADVIILGLSRSGKTPTALYLALNFCLKVANYPFTADDLPVFQLSDAHKRNREKLLGLMISPERLTNIRKERRSEGSYADYSQVCLELDALRHLYARENIPSIDSSNRSVEEIAALVVDFLDKKSRKK